MICSITCVCCGHGMGAHCLTDSGNGKSVHWGVKQIWILILVLTLASSNLEHITPHSEEGEGEERFCGDLRL